ncbi:MAG: class I SAM-dependent methyltransferase [Chthoniobacterales bacterium]
MLGRMVTDLPSRNFRPHLFGVGAWTDNIPFACDLIATLKPRLFVELGTDRGESYFAFCQSVAENETATRCFAVDTWLGDEQAGGYDETTFAEVSEHNQAHYEKFSTLLRSSFEEALSHFAAESIDLLHLDGLHTEAAVRHDIEAWLPKLRPGGILLMHDVSVRTRDFGVWKVWEELQMRGRFYTFAHGTGLGVWQKPPATKLLEPLETLLGGRPDAVAQLTQYYGERARELQEKIARQWRDGSIRETALARQTTIQIFHTHDGTHREEDSLGTRIGHGSWKDLSMLLPAGAGAAPLRIDFFSAYTTVDLASIRVTCGAIDKFIAGDPEAFDQIVIAGDAERLPHPEYLRLKITGPDPQLYLPPLALMPNESPIRVILRLRVSATIA